MNEQQRDFKGVWIAREIWLDERLNALDKVILAEINSLDGPSGCFASNQYIADFCQCSATKVSTAISKLIELGYISVASFDGRTRILKTCLSKFERQTFKKSEADLQNLKENNTDNKERIITGEKTPSTPEGGNCLEKEAQTETRRFVMFERFWEAYPRKVDKKGAERAFWRIKGLADIFPQIIEALETCKASEQWKKEGGRFIPHPTTWIRQERWTATIEAPKDENSSFDPDEFFAAAVSRAYGEGGAK